uniref:Uncharacterized protein n=1 Tax=viral metagenome TaxID=1070528 RepID=A0A6M3KGW3_9ZZZZ
MKEVKDAWSADGMVFYHYNHAYMVSPSLGVVMIKRSKAEKEHPVS